MIQALNINKSIVGKKILNNVSLSFKSGEIVSIIGPSGAGKTTFLRAVSLIDPPDSGFLEIDKENYIFPLRKNRVITPPYPNLTIVFQQFFIWPHLTIKENLTLPLRKIIDKKHFAEVVDLFQMESFLDRYPNEVSMGQRQRAALARALLLKPNYLLLDEITSALDVEQSHLILGHLKRISNNGVGIILVTHALHLASKISSRVIFLDQGDVIEEGTGHILTNPKTDRLKTFVNASKKII